MAKNPQEQAGDVSAEDGLVAFLERRKDSVGVIKDIFTILAIIVGGIWTWMLFSTFRENYPRLSIEHRITHRRLSNDRLLLVMDVNTSNTGKTVVRPLVGWFAIDQILPLSKEQFDKLKVGEIHPSWSQLVPPTWFIGLNPQSKRYLEPGESETHHQEVILGGSANTVRVFTFFAGKQPVVTGGQDANPQEATHDSVGWDRYSVYELEQSRTVNYTDGPQLRVRCARRSRSGKGP